ncbi:MAG: hypothetical protein Tsb0018_01180 [Opitutales bacterium]
MSNDEPKNPLEELQQHIQELLHNAPLRPNIAPTSHFKAESAKGHKHEQEANEQKQQETLKRIREFNLKPKEIRDYLNRFVIQQQEAKKVLSVAICDHYNHIRQCIDNKELTNKEYAKPNILILGPTGVGKTYLMRNIAQLIGVPFVKADATKFSETGYVGNDVEDLVRDLVRAAHGNIELAQYGIVYIDEIDKIARSASKNGGPDVSGRGVQINLLKLMEETEVSLFSPTDIMAQMRSMMEMPRDGKPKKKTINTRHILFIVSGAFDELAETIEKRMEKASIGFAHDPRTRDENSYKYLKFAETKDFIKYGFEPEFVGRLPVRVACEALAKGDLARILTSSEGSILRQYHNDFQGYGIDFNITPEAIQEVAKRAHGELTGARGLVTVLEKTFRDFKFELPSTAIKTFDVSAETISNPDAQLAQLLKDNKHLQEEVLAKDLERFVESFKNEHDITLAFTQEAVKMLIKEAQQEDKTIRALCELKFKDYQHGLQIVARNQGKLSFEIDLAAVNNPDETLSQWIVESFKHDDTTSEENTAG